MTVIFFRCGRLVYHLGLPYSFLTFTYVEDSIKTVYCEDKCGNCSLKTQEDEDFCKNVSLATKEKTAEASQRHHHHHHQSPKPDTPDTPENPPPSGLHHHHHRHKGHQRQGHSDNCDTPVGSENLQLSLPQKKL
uniref:Selenoprotein P N-terminal domain-containing protein n=1 Tax=Capra hircus TaxID=9925 RepID=A0A452DSC7_CAPHI